jgi:hypothetical protein
MKILSNILKKVKATHLIIAGLLLIVGLQKCSNDKLGDQLHSVEIATQQQDSILYQRFNNLEQTVFTTTTKSFNNYTTEMLRHYDKKTQELLERLEANNQNIKRLYSSVNVVASFIGEGYAEPIIIEDKDTVSVIHNNIEPIAGIKEFEFDDEYLQANIEVPTNLEKLFLNYKFSPGDMYIDIYEKERLFKPNITMANVSFDHPNVSLEKSNIFVRSTPETKLTIGIGAGFGATFIDGRVRGGFFVGPQVNIPIIRIKRRRLNN